MGSQYEYKRPLSKMNNKRNSELLQAFKMFDTNGDGKVTLGDLKCILSKLSYGGQTTDATIKALLKKTDNSQYSAITFDKFHVLWNYLTIGENDMRQAFNKLDLNKDGYVSRDELAQYLGQSGLLKREVDAKVQQCFNSLDLNGDGKISYPEFVMSWKFRC